MPGMLGEFMNADVVELSGIALPRSVMSVSWITVILLYPAPALTIVAMKTCPSKFIVSGSCIYTGSS